MPEPRGEDKDLGLLDGAKFETVPLRTTPVEPAPPEPPPLQATSKRGARRRIKTRFNGNFAHISPMLPFYHAVKIGTIFRSWHGYKYSIKKSICAHCFFGKTLYNPRERANFSVRVKEGVLYR